MTWTDARIRYVKSVSAGICVRCHSSRACRPSVHCVTCQQRNRDRMAKARARRKGTA